MSKTIKVLIQDGGIIPVKGTPDSIGYDITTIKDGKIVGEQLEGLWTSISYIEYETGLYIAPQLNEGFLTNLFTLMVPRSSITKKNLMLKNNCGIIDVGYSGQILCRFNYLWQPNDVQMFTDFYGKQRFGVSINNDKIYKKNDAVAQLIFMAGYDVDFEYVKELPETKRGLGGFGSTTPNQ